MTMDDCGDFEEWILSDRRRSQGRVAPSYDEWVLRRASARAHRVLMRVTRGDRRLAP